MLGILVDNMLIMKWGIYACLLVILLYAENKLARHHYVHRYPQDVKHLVLALTNGLGVVLLLSVPLFYFLSLEIGFLWQLSLEPWMTILVGIVALDSWQYAWHRLNHRIPLLWRFHQVHHADREMTISTAFRFHPVEMMISMGMRMLVLTMMGVPVESVLIYDAISLPIIWFHHANITLPDKVERLVRLMIVTPGMHEVHHSRVREEMDSNYASVLSLWDRVFGSYKMDALRPIALGVKDIKHWKSLKLMLFMPWHRLDR